MKASSINPSKPFLMSMLALFALGFLFVACGDDDEGGTPNPTITGFTPTSAKPGATVTITGTNFSTTPADNIVTFNNIAATVTAATSTSITTTVPETATDGKIVVGIANNTNAATSADDFDVIICGELQVALSAEMFTLTATVSGGEAPYTVTLNDGESVISNSSETTFTFTELVGQEHSVEVLDANACEATGETDEVATFVDPADDQRYNIVQIGDQVWFAENYNRDTDGAGNEARCYDNDITNCEKFGYLYTWNEANKDIAPEGWRLPSVGDWDMLRNSFTNPSEAGIALKSGGTSGFEGLLGGRYRTNVMPNRFDFIDLAGYFWTSDESSMDRANARNLDIDTQTLGNEVFFKSDELSLRFIQIK